jgi:actin
MFDSHVVPYLALPSQPTCLAWSRARTGPALLVDIGAGQTQVTAVAADGHVLASGATRTTLAGRALSTVLSRDLHLDHLPWPITTQLLNHCVVVDQAVNLEREIAQSAPVNLSDMEVEAGLPAKFGEERYRCAELLFDPRPLGLELDQGLSHVIARSLKQVSDDALRRELSQHITLSGGLSQLHGLATRLAHDLRTELDHVVNVHVDPAAGHAVWLGAARAVTHVGPVWYSRDDFFEQGSRVFIDPARL